MNIRATEQRRQSQLKYCGLAPEGVTERTFRAQVGAAPLKRWMRVSVRSTRDHRIPRSIERGPVEAHGVHRTARRPLKRTQVIPRPLGRGPVEACSRASDGAQTGAFRARAGAAPLKPMAVSTTLIDAERIPRPRGRGPVEASCAMVTGAPVDAQFRARAGAAPLKHISRSQCRPIAHSAPARARPR